MGNIYTDYDPKGALGGLFAPAYLKGFEPSEKALGDFYNSKSHLTDADLESTRMPWDWMAPRAVNSSTFGRGGMGAGGMGGDLPEYLAYGDRSGIMDPAALKALAQGTPYDLNARRESGSAKAGQQCGAKRRLPATAFGALWLLTGGRSARPLCGLWRR